MKQWIEPDIVDVPEELRQVVGGHPLIAETLCRRGIVNPLHARGFLNPADYTPTLPFDLPDIERAVERIEYAIRQQQKICVWGDFDVDGQTATSLLVSALKMRGARNVSYYIPDRQTEGHGVHLPKLKQIIAEGIHLIITCDTGISAHEAVDFAQAQGVDVIVTDHHNLPPKLPNSFANINPKLFSAGHPLRELPGVGCAYKVIEALFLRGGRENELAGFLDLVALGIVADVAVQVNDTRYLLQRGLDGLRSTRRLGLQALIEKAELRPDEISEEHIGFSIAPRLNALGRLGDANLAVDLLTTTNLERARILASQLEGLNIERKALSEQVYQGAVAQIKRDPGLLEYNALVLSHPGWPAGIIGIVANRLVEQYNRPVILITTPANEIGRGSARSVDGCDISLAIEANQQYLEGFGGHTMAAGLSIRPERIPDFRRALSRAVGEMLRTVEITPSLRIDGYVALNELSIDLVRDLERLAPFGAGNPALTLASRNLKLRSHRVIGRTGEHLQLTIEDEHGQSQSAVWWQGAERPLPDGVFDLAFVARANDYKGERRIQIEWVDARPAVNSAVDLWSKRQLEIIDCRHEAQPYQMLEKLKAQHPAAIVWAEGESAKGLGLKRHELQAAETLIIWTVPPGMRELYDVLEKVRPQKVFVFAESQEVISHESFLKILTGMVKNILSKREGKITLSELAAAVSQRETTIRSGLEWLTARGDIELDESSGDLLYLRPGSKKPNANSEEINIRLKALLKETEAYRRYFRSADIQQLIGQRFL